MLQTFPPNLYLTIKTMKKLQKEYLGMLEEFIAFKTVSTDSSFQADINKAVAWLTNLFKKNGFKVRQIKGKNHNPIIIAKYEADPKLRTILVYGHYDVQPADKSDGWISDPFVLTKRKDRYIARGAVDNKGQILAHIVSVFSAIKAKTLSSNVIFMIEGNEESGNPSLSKIIKENKKLLECDLVIISDGEMRGTSPTLDVSFRGGGNMRIVYQTHSNDRHSGLFGGMVPNPALELSKMLSKIKINNEITFGGLKQNIEISGINSGYTGNGFKNIIPGKAEARLNIRTVHPQVSKYVMKEVEEFIRRETPSFVKLLIETEVHCEPIFLDTDHEEISPIKKLLSEIHGQEIIHQHVGGSIPVVSDFKNILKKPMTLIPLCNDDCNMHGVDENFSEYHMKKALEFTSTLWRKCYY